MAFTDQQVADYIRNQGWAGGQQPVNASAIYGAAQGYGVDASQLDRVGASQGWWGNTGATDWVTSKGLAGGLGTQAPSTPMAPPLQISGTPTPAANSPANPYMTGGAPAAPAAPPNPYSPQSNPYMPAGGPGSNYGNDPRSGGPASFNMTGNQNLSGLSKYLWDNPSTLAMGNEVTRQVNNNLQRNVLPGIGDQFSASGTYGGSRHGVAEGLAVGESMSGLAGALANLYGNQFNQDRGYGLQSDALDFNIHRGNLSDMRQGQMDQLGFLDQMQRWNQQGIGAATQVQNTPLTRWQQFSDTATRIGGMGSQNSQQLNGNPYLSAAGGAITAMKLFGG